MKNYLLLEITKDTPKGLKYQAVVVVVDRFDNVMKVVNNWQPVNMQICENRKQAFNEKQIKEEIYKKQGNSFAEFCLDYINEE